MPSSAPAIVPAPPMRMMAMNSTDRIRFQYSGGSRPTNEANSAPAMPAKNDEMAKAISL